jgi:hypothetical protein
VVDHHADILTDVSPATCSPRMVVPSGGVHLGCPKNTGGSIRRFSSRQA